MIDKRSLLFMQSFLTSPFLQLFSYHLLLCPYLLETVTHTTAVASPPPKPALSHATLVATPTPKPAFSHVTVVAMPSHVPALTHTTPVHFFSNHDILKKIKSSRENNFSAKVKSILQEFVFNVCTGQ